MNNFLNEYFGFYFELNIELNHLLARFNEKMNIQNVLARATYKRSHGRLENPVLFKLIENVVNILNYLLRLGRIFVTRWTLRGRSGGQN